VRGSAKINGAAVGHVDADHQAGSIGNQSVRAGNDLALRSADHRHLTAMHLLGNAERDALKTEFFGLTTMPVPQAFDDHRTLRIHIDFGMLGA
jgi:hypothetical protein